MLLGLLAMHSLNLQSHSSEVAVSTAEAHHNATALDPDHASSPTTSGVADVCRGDCGTDHTMLGACILALAVGILTLVGAAVLSRWSTVGLALARLIRTTLAVIPRAPPSLTVLSISRT